MVEERRRFSLTNLFRRGTPTPEDRKIFNPGIQEKDTSYMITSPILYHVAQSSVIVRTCTTQLKNEIFRRGYTWEEKFVVKCADCGNEHKSATVECIDCSSVNLIKPDKGQLKYAHKFLDKYVNSSEQMFIDVLKELEDDLNIMDDAYLVLVKEYFIDGNGEIRAQRVKEMYRGDPVTMAIFSDEDGNKGEGAFTCLHHRGFV
jgi:ribosomal protein S27E